MTLPIMMISRYIALLIAFMYVLSLERLYQNETEHHLDEKRVYFRLQSVFILLFHFIGHVQIFMKVGIEQNYLILYGIQVLFFVVSSMVMESTYKKLNLTLFACVQFMYMLGLLFLTRLSFDQGFKQFQFVLIGMIVMFITLWLYPRMKFLKHLGWLYLVLSVGLIVMANETINGARNWMRIGGFSFQPSELVKILFIFFISGVLSKKKDKLDMLYISGATLILVGLLAYQRDLGSALIFYVIYILILYVHTSDRKYIVIGFIVTLLGGAGAYVMFSHVRVRVEAWLDPWSDISRKGYQIAQSLFAIGHGGMTGAGLTNGMPEKIPVVATDFIFAGIVEAYGLIIGLILIYILGKQFFASLQTVIASHIQFDFLLSSGLAMILAFQAFLIMGGVIKLIPLTGVTLPFVSAGGTSVVVSFLMIGLIQGVSLNRYHQKHRDEYEQEELSDET